MGSTITIEFHGDRLLGIENERGAFVPLKPLVQGMGLDWSAQLQRLKRDPILSEGVVMITTPSDQEGVCLPLDLVPGFLFRIDAGRVAVAVRGKVLHYQRECYSALARAFTNPHPSPKAGAHHGPNAEMPTAEARKLVAEARSTFRVMAARELWFSTGLPRTPSMYEQRKQLALFPSEYSSDKGGR